MFHKPPHVMWLETAARRTAAAADRSGQRRHQRGAQLPLQRVSQPPLRGRHKRLAGRLLQQLQQALNLLLRWRRRWRSQHLLVLRLWRLRLVLACPGWRGS